MAGGSILKMILKENKNNPKALKAINEILNKAKVKDDSDIKKEKLKISAQKIQTKKVAKDDSEIMEAKQNRKKLIREELDAWAKGNEPEEGWGLTDKKYKEIKLRKKFLEEKPKVSWVEYLESNGLKIVKKVAKNSEKTGVVFRSRRRAKDDSEVLETKIKKLDFAEPKKIAKDDMALLSMARKLQSVNVKKIKENEIYKHVDDLKKFLESAMIKLKDDSLIDSTKNIFQMLDKIPKNIDLKKTEVPQNMVNQVLNAIKQINKSQKEV